MSRNQRRMAPVATRDISTKSTTKRRVSKDSSSDDDDVYAGVDDLSGSDGEEPDVELAEEQAIIEDTANTPRPSIDEERTYDDSPWNGIDDDVEEGEFLPTSTPFFEDSFSRTYLFNPDLFEDYEISPTKKNVRFADDESDGSLISDADQYGELYPDLFLDQDSLQPAFRQLIENSASEASDDEIYRTAFGNMGNSSDDSDEVAGAEEGTDGEASYDDSDSDLGETTDEDLPDAARSIDTRAIARRPSDASSDAEEIVVNRRGPRLGQFVHDITKPFAVLGPDGKTIMMFKAKVRRNTTGSRPQQLTPIPEQAYPFFSPGQDISPMLSTNFVAQAMQGEVHGLPYGPPEAFYPFVDISPNGAISQDSITDGDDEYDYDDDNDLNLHDLVDFGGDSCDEVEGDEDAFQSTDSQTFADPSSTPARPTTARSEDQILGSIPYQPNSATVGQFRRNQRTQQLIHNGVTAASLEFPEQNVISGVRHDKLQEVGMLPITPARKRKTQKTKGRHAAIDSSPLNHLTGGDMAHKKRKLDFLEQSRGQGHKRSKSLM